MAFHLYQRQNRVWAVRALEDAIEIKHGEFGRPMKSMRLPLPESMASSTLMQNLIEEKVDAGYVLTGVGVLDNRGRITTSPDMFTSSSPVLVTGGWLWTVHGEGSAHADLLGLMERCHNVLLSRGFPVTLERNARHEALILPSGFEIGSSYTAPVIGKWQVSSTGGCQGSGQVPFTDKLASLVCLYMARFAPNQEGRPVFWLSSADDKPVPLEVKTSLHGHPLSPEFRDLADALGVRPFGMRISAQSTSPVF